MSPSMPMHSYSVVPKNRIRLYDADARLWLHQDGASTTSTVDHAWSGTRAQGRTLRARAKREGEPWPWKAIAR